MKIRAKRVQILKKVMIRIKDQNLKLLQILKLLQTKVTLLKVINKII